ncbi:MAG: hypothetical protein ABH871_05485 [Pseudomonadota bacterium]
MREKKERLTVAENAGSTQHSAPDLIRLMRGVSRHAGQLKKAAPDSVIAIYKDRLTYTFIMNEEVASIHFDRSKGEIFFRGHNISHMDLGAQERKSLISLIGVLEEVEGGTEFLSAYSATLDRVLADK